MYRPSRTRRILKWTGVGLSLLILATWAVSLWWTFFYILPGDRSSLAFGRGIVGGVFSNFDLRKAGFATGFRYQGRNEFGFNLPEMRTARVGPDSFDEVGVPFWLPLLLTAIPTTWLWHRDRRRIRPGCCLRCGYDLTGNTSGVCSECGLAKPPPAAV